LLCFFAFVLTPSYELDGEKGCLLLGIGVRACLFGEQQGR
jgi:hypothetical protein